MRQCGLVARFYVETEAGSPCPVWLGGASSPQPRSGDEPRREKLVDRLRERRGIAFAPLGGGEMAQVLLVRHVAKLDQYGRHVRRAQDDEACGFERLLMQPRAALEFVYSRLGELKRECLGLALRQIDEDVGDIVRLGGEVDTGDDVGAVFVFGHAC